MNIPASDPQGTTQKRAKIQLISLVAILFLLFAAFAMSTLTMVKKSEIPINLPVAGCIDNFDHSKPAVILQVTDAGLYWDKELIAQRELPERLAKYTATYKNPVILLAGSDQAKLGTTVETLDEIRKAGITQVEMETVYRETGK